MHINELKEKIRQDGTAVVPEHVFNSIFSGTSQWVEVSHFCQETVCTFEYNFESKPRIFIFRKSYSKIPPPSRDPNWSLRMRRFTRLPPDQHGEITQRINQAA